MSGVVSKEVKVNKGLQRHRFQMATVAAIRQVQPNGLKVVSTFSGGGGTCLGLTLAGYDVVWANDCDPHARKTYTENLKKPIDGRLINDITAADILSDINLKQGELDVFEGSLALTFQLLVAVKRAGIAERFTPVRCKLIQKIYSLSGFDYWTDFGQKRL